MHIPRLKVVVLAAVAAATVALAVAPSKAQTTPVQTAVKKRPTQVAMTTRPPSKVTVRKRSYLDPGTETKTHAEHYQDYAFPPTGTSYGADPNDFRINFNRMPFSTCFDLPGFCR